MCMTLVQILIVVNGQILKNNVAILSQAGNGIFKKKILNLCTRRWASKLFWRTWKLERKALGIVHPLTAISKTIFRYNTKQSSCLAMVTSQ